MEAGLVKGEGFAVDASVIEADASRYERLDHHRGRGQQQITVKHVTVNADQAEVTDQIVTGKPESIPPAGSQYCHGSIRTVANLAALRPSTS
jgi:hypothetical protein